MTRPKFNRATRSDWVSRIFTVRSMEGKIPKLSPSAKRVLQSDLVGVNAVLGRPSAPIQDVDFVMHLFMYL